MNNQRPIGLQAIDREMGRRHADALASCTDNAEMAARVAASLTSTKTLRLFGMGGTYAVYLAAAPPYRALGIEAIPVSSSEQLGQPLPIMERTVIGASQTATGEETRR